MLDQAVGFSELLCGPSLLESIALRLLRAPFSVWKPSFDTCPDEDGHPQYLPSARLVEPPRTKW
jgi:hypothetical protein